MSQPRLSQDHTPQIRKLFYLGYSTPLIARVLGLRYHEVNLYIQLEKRKGITPLPPEVLAEVLDAISTQKVLDLCELEEATN